MDGCQLAHFSVESNRIGDRGSLGAGELRDGDCSSATIAKLALVDFLRDAANPCGNPHVQEFALAANSV